MQVPLEFNFDLQQKLCVDITSFLGFEGGSGHRLCVGRVRTPGGRSVIQLNRAEIYEALKGARDKLSCIWETKTVACSGEGGA
mgnify:CR=1 FL=1